MKNQEEAIPCAFCCNDSYAPYLAVSLASLVANTERKVKIYIFDDDISECNKNILSKLSHGNNNIEITFVSVNCKKVFSAYSGNSVIESSTFGRLLVPDFCNEEKIIYCDSDVIFLGDIGHLHDQPLMKFGIGAVPEVNVLSSEILDAVIHERLALSHEHVYFNAGVLLIDVMTWRKGLLSRKLLEAGSRMKKNLVWGDQDILNIGFECAYAPLDHIFNFTTRAALGKEPEFRRDRDAIIVRHFESERKPWLTSMYTREEPLPHFEDFWKYAALTPFYAWLQERYEKNAPLDSPPEYTGNIFKPDAATLSSLRGKLRQKTSSQSKTPSGTKGV